MPDSFYTIEEDTPTTFSPELGRRIVSALRDQYPEAAKEVADILQAQRHGLHVLRTVQEETAIQKAAEALIITAEQLSNIAAEINLSLSEVQSGNKLLVQKIEEDKEHLRNDYEEKIKLIEEYRKTTAKDLGKEIITQLGAWASKPLGAVGVVVFGLSLLLLVANTSALSLDIGNYAKFRTGEAAIRTAMQEARSEINHINNDTDEQPNDH